MDLGPLDGFKVLEHHHKRATELTALQLVNPLYRLLVIRVTAQHISAVQLKADHPIWGTELLERLADRDWAMVKSCCHLGGSLIERARGITLRRFK